MTLKTEKQNEKIYIYIGIECFIILDKKLDLRTCDKIRFAHRLKKILNNRGCKHGSVEFRVLI